MRDDGLTDAEGLVADALTDAVTAFGRLKRQHPDELRDFIDGIHRCQDALALRAVRRAFPKGWPVKPSCVHCGSRIILASGYCDHGHADAVPGID